VEDDVYDDDLYEDWLDDKLWSKPARRRGRSGRARTQRPAIVESTDEDQYTAGEAWFDEFFAEGLITGIVRQLKSGKEASVFLCRGNPDKGPDLMVVKAYRPRAARRFQDDSMYTHGRVILNGQIRRAVLKKTGFGRQVEQAMWMAREHEHLELLHGAGIDVPRPARLGAWGILMEYIGDEYVPAPQLKDVRLEPDQAREMFDRLIENVEVMLALHLVHGDLSPYNVLVWEGRPVIIDLPQAVDARTNRNAHVLLERDLRHLCAHFARYGIERDAPRLADSLWHRYLFAEL
jgi:RIO kinase 1